MRWTWPASGSLTRCVSTDCRIARDENVPAYVVAGDRTLRNLATTRPRTPAELSAVFGMGPARIAKYGEGFLEVIGRHTLA